MDWIESVSYTHLDVYKRQDCVPMKKTDKTKLLVTWKKHQNIASLIGKAVRLKFYLDNADTVSYTHLDVYKRQILSNCRTTPKYWMKS